MANNGNCAAMREAMRDIAMQCQYVAEGISDESDYGRVTLMRIRDKARAALASQPRNCDVGTPADQADRFQKFCHLVRKRSCNCSNKCPLINETDIIHCQFAWAQMPYEEVK